ncbi:MAG: hypothetical protein HY941_12035 [Gammaproteobacteria bacterium]|nr:hypothetical protein [Gammaproteobacteria bacterium]
MTNFTVLATLLMIGTLVVLMYPLLIHDETRARVRGDVSTAVVLALLVPLATAALYVHLGRPDVLRAAARPAAGVDAVYAPTLDASLRTLRERLSREPNDARGWMTLARAEFEQDAIDAAVAAYARAHALLGDEPQLLAEYAEALAVQHDGVFTATANTLLARALFLQPDNRHALWLAGLAAYARGDTATAIERWERALAAAPMGGAEAQRIEAALAEARAASAVR